MKLRLLFMALLMTLGFQASAMVENATFYARMNAMSPLEGLGIVVNKTQSMLVAVYDFAVQGGDTGTIKLLDDKGNPAILPDNVVIQDVLVEVITAVTSSDTATVAIGANTTTDLLGATAKGSLTVGAFLDGVPADAAANAVKTTAERQITATVATTALTAGKIRAYIRYVISE